MASQLLCDASCYERIATSDANVDLKQPLVVVQDLESPQSSQSSSHEEQNADIARQRVSTRVLTKLFCGLVLQAITFSASWVMCKKCGNNTQPDESAPLSNWTLYLLIHADAIAFFTLICMMGFAMMATRKGSIYMRKKFDDDTDAPNSESVWTGRFLLISVMDFRFGFTTGCYATRAIFDIALGRPVSLVPLLCLPVDLGLYYLMMKCFDWGHQLTTADDELEEDEEDSFFI